MTTTNYAKSRVALFLAGSSNEYPAYFVIGSGSGTALVTQTELINTFDRQAFTSTNGSTIYKVTYAGDWNSVELSGLGFKEFGIIKSGTGLTGSIWTRTGLPTITFDGTNELRIEETVEVF